MEIAPAPKAASSLRRFLLDVRRDAKFALSSAVREAAISLDGMHKRRQHAAALEATDWALQALEGRGQELLGLASRLGASQRGLRQLARAVAKEPEEAARVVYENLSLSCEICGDTGYGAHGRRCACFRAKVAPAYRCQRCRDSGVLLGDDGARPCRCRQTERRWADSPLISAALVWDLPGDGQAAEHLLDDPAAALDRSTVVWLEGGQQRPAPELVPSAYAGYGVARLCLDRLQQAAGQVRRLTPLDLLAESRHGAEWFRDHEVIFLDRPETAVPSADLRQALELLLAEAWDWSGVVVVATELSFAAPAPSARPTWRDFVARAGPSLDRQGWADLRQEILDDPAVPFVGEVCALMLAGLSSDDYLTPRARHLVERMPVVGSVARAVAA